MTTTIANKPRVAATSNETTAAPGAPPSPDATIETMPSETAAASFSRGVPSARKAPFNPPPSPALIDETKASDVEAAREKNRETIALYNKAYGEYIETYATAVEAAPNLERVRSFGPPVSYDPCAKLPVEQRAQYDHDHDSHLATKMDAASALGARILEEKGVKVPGAYAFVEGKVNVLGNGAEGRVTAGHEGVETEGKLKFGASTDAATALNGLEPMKAGVDVHIEVDPKTGKPEFVGGARYEGVSVELGNDGHHKIEVDAKTIGIKLEDGALSTELGPKLDEEIAGREAKIEGRVGSTYDGKTQRVEVYAKGAAKIEGLAEVEVKAGVGLQLLTADYVKAVIDPNQKDFFDVAAMRAGGR